MAFTHTQILTALSKALSGLVNPEPADIETEPKSTELVEMHAPAMLGSSITSQQLNNWLVPSIHQAEGVEFSTEQLATTTRVAQWIREPKHLEAFMRDEIGVDLVASPMIDLPINDAGQIDNSPAALRTAVFAATHRFYGDLVDDVDEFDDMSNALGELYSEGVPRHRLVEVFQYWDLIPDETIFQFVLQYFLCAQTEKDWADAQAAAREAKKVAQQEALEAAATKAAGGATLKTVTSSAALPSTS